MRKFAIVSVLLVFMIATLACQITGGPTPPRLLTISQAEAKSLENMITNLGTGVATIKVTESQVSSYLTYNLPKDNSIGLLNPQVFFEPDQIHFFATYAGDFLQVDGRIVMTVSVVNNQPRFNILSVDFGPLPIPGALTKTLTDQLDNEVAKALTRNTTGYQLESITISTGGLILTLRKK